MQNNVMVVKGRMLDCKNILNFITFVYTVMIKRVFARKLHMFIESRFPCKILFLSQNSVSCL